MKVKINLGKEVWDRSSLKEFLKGKNCLIILVFEKRYNPSFRRDRNETNQHMPCINSVNMFFPYV